MTYSSNSPVSNAQSQLRGPEVTSTELYSYIYIHNVKEKLDIYIKSLIS